MTKYSPLPTYNFYKQLDSSLNFEYSKLEKVYNPYDASSAHRHDYYEIIIFNEKGGKHEIDFQTYPINKNTIHFITPGQVHLLRRNKNVTGHVLAFKEEVFLTNSGSISDDLLSFSTNRKPVIYLDRNQRQKINKLLLNLTAEFSLNHFYKPQTISAYLYLFLIEVKKLDEQNPVKKKTSVAGELNYRFRRLVDKNILIKHSVAEYASLLNITAGHLNDTVKRETGKNASEIIHERLILEAKRMLYHSTKSIKEISAFLNYEDPSYFNRFFRTHTGITPREFRDQVREEYS